MAVQKVTVYFIESYGIVSFWNALNEQKKSARYSLYSLGASDINFLLAKKLDLFGLRPHSLLYNSESSAVCLLPKWFSKCFQYHLVSYRWQCQVLSVVWQNTLPFSKSHVKGFQVKCKYLLRSLGPWYVCMCILHLVLTKIIEVHLILTNI